ncbi:MAG: DUF4091 domain-containing protein [Phycisphaerae bacterium]|nr:DUF4091 domain-containing protein [Phycisphaerae bacterium]
MRLPRTVAGLLILLSALPHASATAPVPVFTEDFEHAAAGAGIQTGQGIGNSRCFRSDADGPYAPSPEDAKAALDALRTPRSLTVTGWLRAKADAKPGAHQTILSCPGSLSLLMHGQYQGRLGLVLHRHDDGRAHYVWSSWFSPFLTDDTWVFFAITYDAARKKDNVAFYVGTPDRSVTLDSTATLPGGPVLPGAAKALVIGGAAETLTSHFHGLLDNLRLFVAGDDTPSAALTLEQVEAIRRQDLGLTVAAATQPSTRPSTPVTATRGLRAVAVDVLDRVFPDRMPTGAATAEPIHVPRNAVACFQFGVHSETGGTLRCEIESVSSPGSKPSAYATKVYELLPVPVEANNNGGSRTQVGVRPPGTWLNALVREAPFEVAEVLVSRDEMQLRPGRTTALLVEITVNADAAPGLYRHRLRLRHGTVEVVLPFSLVVRETVLPAEGGLSTTYWLSADPKDLTTDKPPLWWSEPHWQLLAAAGRTLHAFGQDSILTPLMNGPEPLIRTIRHSDGSTTFDFSRFDRWSELFLGLGFRRIEGQHIAGGHTLRMPPMQGGIYVWDADTGTKTPLITRESRNEAWLEFLPVFYRALGEHLANKGWIEHYSQCQMDEPHDLESYRQLTALAREHLPGARTQDAINSDPAKYSPFVDVHVFALTTLAKNQELAQQRRANGQSVWLYHCCSPYPPYPNRHLDESLVNSRLYPWLAHLLRADGYLYWAANMYRGADPYTSSIGPLPNGSQAPGHPPGDNWFFYPAPDGLRASLRMVAFREGLIDHRLVSLLAEREPDLARQIIADIARSATDHAKDPASFHAARKKLLDALARFPENTPTTQTPAESGRSPEAKAE